MNNGLEQFKETTLIKMNEYEDNKGQRAILHEISTLMEYTLRIIGQKEGIQIEKEDKNYDRIKNLCQKGIAELVEDGFLLEKNKHQYVLTSKGRNNK